jgi:chromosome partitioning protein
MGKVIAFINQKGGVGKSTLTANIAAGVRRKGFDTLMVDVDPQANLTYITGAYGKRQGTEELLTGKAKAADVIQATAQGDVISSSAGLALDGLIAGNGKEYRLREALEPVRDIYDFTVIDCPPSLGILTINALTAATGVIIPVQADVLSLQALGQFSDTFETVKTRTNAGLKLYGIALTRYSRRALLSQEVARVIEDTAKKLNTKVYAAPIRESVAVREAQAARVDIFSHSPRSGAAADFAALTDEILKDCGCECGEKENGDRKSRRAHRK